MVEGGGEGMGTCSVLVCLFAVQRFSNNDHLAVHRQKHEFSLKFGISSKSGDALLVGK